MTEYRFYATSGPLTRRIYLQRQFPPHAGWFKTAYLDFSGGSVPEYGRAMNTTEMKEEFPTIYERFSHLLEEVSR